MVVVTVMYDEGSYAMDWNKDSNRWEIEISTSICNDSTIEVVSSASASASSSESNCR